tara:strand:- start:4207 stop:4731 length:525 start_codon:yes stop_codon:yes gene_type:complete
MACSITITGRALQCKDALGGIRKAYIGLYTGTDQYATPSAGAIADSSAALVLYEFDMQSGSSSFTQTVNASTENGSVFYTQVLALSFNKMIAEDVAELGDLNKARLTIVVVDKNDQYWVMGNTSGCEVTGGTFVSGQAMGDLNGATMEVTAMEITAAPRLTTISGGSITFTAAT